MFTGTNIFKDAESKSEEFPLHRPAVFAQTAILCSLIVNMHNLTKANEYSVMFMQIIRVLLKLVQTHRHVGSHG